MKNKPFFGTVVLLVVCTLFASPGHAFFNNDVDKAKDFMNVGMYPQAIELLKKRITDKPTDAEAHFQLGICYINQSNLHGADERFASAVKLKSDYGYKIGEEFYKIGSNFLYSGQTDSASDFFSKAVSYQPKLKKNIATETFQYGNRLIDQGRYDDADSVFKLAIFFDRSYTNQIGDIFYKRLNDANSKNDRLAILEKAAFYNKCDSYVNQYTKEWITIINDRKKEQDKKLLEAKKTELINRWGEPRKIELTEEGKWITVLDNPQAKDKVIYLSLYKFKAKDNDGIIDCKLAINEYKGLNYNSKEDINGPLKLGKGEKKTIVYVWIKHGG